jgi:hypothetical protein
MCADEALQRRFPAHCTLMCCSLALEVYRIAQTTNQVYEKVGNYACESLRRKACESVCVRIGGRVKENTLSGPVRAGAESALSDMIWETVT